MDIEKPKAYDLMCQYGLVKLRGDKDGPEEMNAFNLYPRPSYHGGFMPPASVQ